MGSRIRDGFGEDTQSKRITNTLVLWEGRGGNARRLEDFYECPEPLGEGAFGTVSKWRLRHSTASQASNAVYVAVKQIRWESIWRNRAQRLEKEEVIRQELSTLIALDHPCIAMIREWFEDTREGVFFVMELCTGGSMQDVLEEACAQDTLRRRMKYAPRLQKYYRDLLYAVSYVHSRGVIHRDLKPDNVMLASPDPGSGIKLIDFGLATVVEGDAVGKDERWGQGTMVFMAPETFLNTCGTLNESSDMWSLGVILTWIATAVGVGKMLHPMLTEEEGTDFGVEFIDLHTAFREHLPMHEDHFKFMPEECCELAGSLLAYTPQERASASECLENEWVRESEDAPVEVLKESGAVNNMKNFKRRDSFQKEMLGLLALNVSDDKVAGPRKAFEALDTSRDGRITRQELADGFKRCGETASKTDIDTIFEFHEGEYLDYHEFLSTAMDVEAIDEDTVVKVFHSLDAQNRGKLKEADLVPVMGSESAHRAVRKYTRRASNSIDLMNFCEALSIPVHKEGSDPPLMRKGESDWSVASQSTATSPV